MAFSITLVCAECGEPCETVTDGGRCLACAYAGCELPAGEVLPGARVHLRATSAEEGERS